MAVQGKTLADIIGIIRGLIGEPLGSRTGGAAGLRYKDSLLTTLFNWHQDDVGIRTRWKSMTSLDTVTASTTVYTLPAACAILQLVEFKDSGGAWNPLQEVNFREQTVIEASYQSGDEPVYQVSGNTIVVLPAWDTSKADGLRYTYIPRPDKLVSATNSSSLAPPGVQAAIWKVVEFCRAQDEKPQLVEQARAGYAMSLEQAMGQASEMRNQRLHCKQDVLFGGHYPVRRGLGRK